MLEAKEDGVPLEQAVSASLGWTGLQELVATGAKLTDTMSDDPLAHVAQGFYRFRRYAPRMLRSLEIEAAQVASPLMAAARLVNEGRGSQSPPTAFLRQTSKWHRHMSNQEDGSTRCLSLNWTKIYSKPASHSSDLISRAAKRDSKLSPNALVN